MNDQVMMDAKFTLFAILLAVAISSPAEPGSNNDIPDYLVVYAEWDVPKSDTVQPKNPWIAFPEAKRLEEQGIVKIYQEVENPDRGVMVAMATVWPAPPGNWSMTFGFPMRARISTRNKTKTLAVKASLQTDVVTTK